MDHSTTTSVKRTARRLPLRLRLFGAVAAVGVGLFVIVGCHGAPTTTTVSLLVSCSSDVTTGYTTTVSMDVPAWTDPNEDIPIGNASISGFLTQGGVFTASFSVQGGTGPLSFNHFDSTTGVDTTVNTVHVTAPAGGQVVVSLDSFEGVIYTPRTGEHFYTCSPAPGTDAVVGTIPVHSGSS